jgi:hypothetical protein
MKKNILILSGFIGLAILSCKKHEVIPSPTPMVELEAHFEGLINGTDVEYTEDVNGYNGSSTFEQYITTTALDTTVYFSSMESDFSGTSLIKIGIGGISWDAGSLSVPSLNQFDQFFTKLTTDTTINYSLSGKQGFVVSFKDKDGNVYTSSLLHDGTLFEGPIENPVFSNMTLESDKSGDYVKFKVTFACDLYRFVKYYTIPPSEIQLKDYDTIRIENAVYSGWIKR